MMIISISYFLDFYFTKNIYIYKIVWGFPCYYTVQFIRRKGIKLHSSRTFQTLSKSQIYFGNKSCTSVSLRMLVNKTVYRQGPWYRHGIFPVCASNPMIMMNCIRRLSSRTIIPTCQIYFGRHFILQLI